MEDFKGVIPHVFLPRHLAQFSNPETLAEVEVKLLKITKGIMELYSGKIPSSTLTLFRTWASLQCTPSLDAVQVSKSIRSLQPGQMLALYLREQNCGFILSAPKEGSYFTISTFPANLNNTLIASSPSHINILYPGQSIKIPESHLLTSDAFAEQLAILHSTEMATAMPTSRKSGHQVTEERDVANTMFVSQWLAAALSDDQSVICKESEFPRIVKKVRDEVLWSNAKLPFRRSGFWMTIKVALQLNLKIEFGEVKGRFLYKLLILRLMIHICCRTTENDIDLVIQMLAKISRRLEKLKRDASAKEVVLDQNSIQLHCKIHEKAIHLIKLVRKKIGINFNAICEKDNEAGHLPLLTDLNFERDVLHTATELNKYIALRNQQDIKSEQKNTLPHPQSWPRFRYEVSHFPPINLLTSLDVNDEVGAGLILRDLENWIHLHLEKSTAPTTQIRDFAFSYANKAMVYYKEDPVGASRMILVLLKIIQVVDHTARSIYPLLQSHHTGINENIIQGLLLPTRIDLERAQHIDSYFRQWNKNANLPSLVEEDSPTSNSFSVKYAVQNLRMQQIRNEILCRMNQKIQEKKNEVLRTKDEVASWRREYNEKSCSYTTNYNRYGVSNQTHDRWCSKCALQNKINNRKIMVYERPLRNDVYSQNAVIFELLIPEEISCLRDLLHLLAFEFCTPASSANVSILGSWKDHPDLGSYYLQRQKRVMLGSTSKLFTASHYREKHADSSIDDFIVNCGYNCTYYGQLNLQLSRNIQDDSIKHLCTFNVEKGSAYSNLQWALRESLLSQNNILAMQSECAEKLKISEFVEFGSIRVGHRLQLRNIYRAIETRKLSFNNPSVVFLVLQTLWEAGPADNLLWYRESHEDFVDPIFTGKMVELLHSFLQNQENNWNDYNNLMVIVFITVRLLEINSDDRVIDRAIILLLKCRQISLKWIADIESVLADTTNEADAAALRNNLIDIAACCSLTFFIDSNSKCFSRIFLESADFPPENAWLQSVAKSYNNIILNKATISKITVAQRNFLRMVRSVGITIEKKLNEMIQTDCANLSNFAIHQWAGAKQGNFSKWSPHPKPAEQVYYSQLIDKHGIMHWIQIDLILGKFLVDGNPVSRLPDTIVHNPIYTRVFENVMFEVQPAGNNTFCTLFKYSACNYYFSMTGQNLIALEQDDQDNIFELLPHSTLQSQFPFLLVQNYSHWWSKKEGIINFRPKHFKDSDFSCIYYKFDLNSKLLTEMKTGRHFLNIKSNTYDKITFQFSRFEDKNYCHVLLTMMDSIVVDVELPRMALHFRLNENLDLLSREHDGKKVCSQQTFGVFIGLQNGLLLEDCDVRVRSENQKLLLVPHGVIRSECHLNHQKVLVSLENLRDPPWFTFEVDERFRQIKAGKSYSAWFYLAHLHAVTSCPLPDPFTGMTGTEKSLQILQSGRCWSSQPFDKETSQTMMEISKLSSIRSYYPKHLRNMESVCWPKNINVCAAHEMYFNIIQHLIRESLHLEFLFPLTKSKQALEKEDAHRKFLTERAYSRHLCYNPNSRMSEIFEKSILIKGVDTKSHNEEPTGNSLGKMRTMATLIHKWTCEVPQSSYKLISELLISSGQLLRGVTGIRFHYMDVTEWIKIDFRNQWLDLYNFARTVREDRLQSHWRLLLTLLAFLGKDVVQLHILHGIATNSNIFREINPPPYNSYDNPQQRIFDRNTVRQIFQECEIGEDAFLTRKGYGTSRSYYSDADREKIASLRTVYASNSNIQIKNLTDTIQQMWPANKCEDRIFMVSSDLINVYNAVPKINTTLNSWYNNLQLANFLEKVSEKLNILELTQRDTQKLPLEAWVNEPFDIVGHPRFEIDYNEKMSLTASSLRSEFLFLCEIENLTNADGRSAEERLKFYREKRQSSWKELEKVILPAGEEYLVEAGMYPRIVPTLLLPKLLNSERTSSWPLLHSLRLIGVLFSLELRASRILKLTNGGLQAEVALQRELETIPRENWDPAKYPEWLLFELEMNMTIRRIQAEVARQMMNPPGGKNSVLQLNMGEGKTAVIVPILAATLANGNQLCRVTVLKSLYQMNFAALRHSLGGMLNRRIYAFPCRRDMKIGFTEAQKILQKYEQCKKMRGVVMTLPEYRLSFRLKIYETTRVGDPQTSKVLLETHQWLCSNVRDILDESDEILHAKYQLIYTVGEQLLPGGGNLRWIIIQQLLKLVATEMRKLWEKYGDQKIEFDKEISDGSSSEIFPPCRLLCTDIYEELVEVLTEAFLNGDSSIQFVELSQANRKIIKEFLTNTQISVADHQEAIKMFEGSIGPTNTILILAGYLKYEVLRLALTKRWRVNYGVNLSGHRKMAVPFKAKDIAAEMTEFGHPDVAICLTHLSYYYSGLSNEQLFQCFELLEKNPNPDKIYGQWISKITSGKVEESIRSYNGVNLKNSKQRKEYLFPALKMNMYVIDFWLSNAVFPREAKQFSGKMMCTAWDLVSEEQMLIVSGFSGTNDSKLLLPLPINQNDLPELEETNEQVRRTLELPENDDYESLPPNVSGRFILQKLVEKDIRVLLDAGALMLELNNKQVATEWLKIHTASVNSKWKAQAAVYFDMGNVLMVTDGQNRPREFELSPFRERLDLCVIYLDDAHTRGTDLKFPRETKACVTLAGGITRDKTVQACMRMRQLGKGHYVSFFASQEADSGIKEFSGRPHTERICTKDVVNWICDNSRTFEKEGLVHWSAAGFNYGQKFAAHEMLQLSNNKDTVLQELNLACSDKELIELMSIYGEIKSEERISKIVEHRFNHLIRKYVLMSSIKSKLTSVRDEILKRTTKYIGDKTRFAQLLDEEQEKELEHELEEERQNDKPGKATPEIPILDIELGKFLQSGSITALQNLMKIESVCSLPLAFKNTTLWPIVQVEGWGPNTFATRNFASVIKVPYRRDKVDEFLRPLYWLASVHVGRCNILLLLSPFEANSFMPLFRSNSVSTLHMFAARLHPDTDNLLNTSELQFPSREAGGSQAFISGRLESQLSVFAGSIYFANKEEEMDYCNFLGLIPRPRSPFHQSEFEKGNISITGFVAPESREFIYGNKELAARCKFQKNPDELIAGIVERRHGFFPTFSHAALIVMESKKYFK